MKFEKLSIEELFQVREKLYLQGLDYSQVNRLIDIKESLYTDYLLEDVSGTGGPSGAAGASTIGIGGGGVAYSNAAFGGMGSVVAAQPSNNTGVTMDPAYTSGGGKTGSGDVGVPYNTGGTKMFQKIPVDNRKGSNRRRKNKMLAQLKGALIKRNDFTKGEGGAPRQKKVMDFGSFSKDQLTKVTHVDESYLSRFELTQEIKDVIDFEKRYHSTFFDQDADDIDKDPHADDFYRDVFDRLEVKNLLPKDYDYYVVRDAIADYANS